METTEPYRGRIAPTPTGQLHLGHAATFWTAFERCRAADGHLILRIEDLDPERCQAGYVREAIEDLGWLGIRWQEGPAFQSERRNIYFEAWRRLRDGGFIYPCRRSRKDVARAALAPHEEEPVFPVEWRVDADEAKKWDDPKGVNWRFRVPDHEVISFRDGNLGEISRTTLTDLGDFLVWNRDDIPAYELAVAVDDAAMGITEVVRGEDLLTSTARQLLLYRAMENRPPAFFHCPLVRDSAGKRLAKRDDVLSVRALREAGHSAAEILKMAKPS